MVGIILSIFKQRRQTKKMELYLENGVKFIKNPPYKLPKKNRTKNNSKKWPLTPNETTSNPQQNYKIS